MYTFPCCSSGGKKSTGGGGGKGSSSKGQSKRKATDELWTEGNPPESVNPLHPFLVARPAKLAGVQDPSVEVLCLLRTLHALNRYWGTLYSSACMDVPYYHSIVSSGEFINSKLTAKVNRQLQVRLYFVSLLIMKQTSKTSFSNDQPR